MAFQKFITLSLADYTTLATTGTVTIGSTTLTYQPDEVLYLVPDESNVTIDATTGSENISNGTNTLNVVTRDTAQTISEEKTIANAVALKFAGTYTGQIVNQENQLRFKYGGSDKLKISTANITSSAHLIPNSGNTFDLGTSTYKWRDAYVGGNLSDGTNSITVANIANKNNFITLTQAEYNALATKDPDTYYFIEEE